MLKKYIASVALIAFAMPVLASAHQSAVYEINGEQYRFVVGSLGEPIAVDDNTGVELRVYLPGHENMAAHDHHAAGGAVTGLESTLKVELQAGSARKTLDLVPAYGEPGSYYAKFYPTVATTLSYRFFGEVNGTPVDLTFTCREEGAAAANEGEKQISTGVKQVSKTGGFGCPVEKEALGFPESSAGIASVAEAADTARSMSVGAFAVGIVALALAGAALRRRS